MIVKSIMGKRILVLDSDSYGNSKVIVHIQQVKQLNGISTSIGKTFEGIGGFKKVKDFDYGIAEQAALEVAVARI